MTRALAQEAPYDQVTSNQMENMYTFIIKFATSIRMNLNITYMTTFGGIFLESTTVEAQTACYVHRTSQK